MKRKLLLMMASLLLAGAVSAQTNYWGNDPDSHAQPSNTPIVASIGTLDGVAATITDVCRLGAFVGDELRGIAQHTDGKFWIQVFYADTTDNISFKFYDGTTEYTTCETTLNGETVTLTGQDEGYGTPGIPVVLNFTTEQTMTQTTEFAQGWSWWSTPVEMAGVDGLTMLENSLGSSGVRIQSLNDGRVDYYDYNGGLWYGQLNAIHNEQMYKVKTNAAVTSELSGVVASPSSHPITINGNSYSWIGFPYNNPVSVSVAMSGFEANSLDQIKSFGDGYTTYYVTSSFTGWYGTLSTLKPGQGYMYKSTSSENRTLVFQTQAGRGEELTENITPAGNTFLPYESGYADNMTVTAVVEIEGNELRSNDYEVAAFVGDECRGSVKLMYVEPIDRYVAFLLIAGDAEESLRFALTDGSDFSWSNDHLMYNTDDVIGSLIEPTILHFGPLGLDDNMNNLVDVYPNPSDGLFNIEGNGIRKVEIINSYGQVIYTKEIKGNNLQVDLSNYAIGTYVLRVVTDSGISTKQLIKK